MFNFETLKKTILLGSLIFLCLVTVLGIGFVPLNVVLLILGAISLLWFVSDLYRGLLLGIIAVNLNTFRFEMGITPVGMTLRPSHIVFAALFLAWVVSLMVKRVHFHRTPLDVPIIGYLLANLVASLIMSPDKMHSLQECFLITVYVTMYFLTINILLEYPHKIKSTVKFFIILGLIHCLYGVLGVFAGAVGVNIGGVQYSGMARGFHQEANLFGIYSTVMAMFFTSYSLFSYKHKFRRYIAIMIIILAIILSTTRSSWFALPFGIGALLIVNRRKIFSQRYFSNIVKAISILLLITVIFIHLGPKFIPDFSMAFRELETKLNIGFSFSEGSGLIRKAGWQTAIEEWQDSKLIGRGTMSASVSGTGYAWLWSSFIQTLHDAGIVGLFFMLWIMICPILFSLKQLRKTCDNFSRWNLSGFIGGCVVLLFTCQFSNFLWLGFPWVFYGIGMAMAMRAKQGNTLEAQNKR